MPNKDSNEIQVRETSLVNSSSSLDCSAGETADELYEDSEMAQSLESKVDLILTRLAEMDKKLTQIESKATNLENKLGMLDNRVQGLEDAHSNTCKTVDGIEAGLNALNTTINEAKAARQKLKVDREKKKRARGQTLVCRSLFQACEFAVLRHL